MVIGLKLSKQHKSLSALDPANSCTKMHLHLACGMDVDAQKRHASPSYRSSTHD
jgi:hypothetical protein